MIVEYIKNKRDKFDFELSLPDSRVYKFLAYFIREHNVYLVYGFEITELKEKENHLNFLANYDVLTGLPNRNKLYNDMIELIDYKSVIILIDIKSMRQINSIYGYDTGNKYLVKFADFLKETFKEYRVYRLYGNIFVLYDSLGLTCAIDEDLYLSRIYNILLDKTIKLNGFNLPINIRLGLSKCEDLEEKNKDYPELQLKLAETALLEAKKLNRDYLSYSKINNIVELYKNNWEWLNRITALIKNEIDGCLVPYFQPIVNNFTGAVEKYEALMRIKIGKKIYTPNFFMSVANESGYIKDLTKILIDEVFKRMKGNHKKVSINLTPLDVENGILNYLINKCKEYNIESGRVTIELLENESFYELEDEVIKFKENGFLISIDDFGVGYSNFSKLISMPIDYIKIDGSLISNIESDSSTYDIVRHIVEISKTLKCHPIAEFVSNLTIYEIIKKLGVEFSQGYYFSPPVPDLKV
ncbi:bifunctional diguanylate cyclase/phosphodiesterase [Deferribacter thermophilus]|uniref:EAL domain-containing protein n=1 Tax=Deferribacter thermophilus TaxID=53573 RepID=UPI003C1DDA82